MEKDAGTTEPSPRAPSLSLSDHHRESASVPLPLLILLEVLRERKGACLPPMPLFVVLPFWPLLRVAVLEPLGAAPVAAAFAGIWDG